MGGLSRAQYRLTRTIFRGLRFHQDGSALLYALYAVCWWTLTVLTFGLAYPFQLASLERFELRHTLYGDLRASFAGSGTRLFLRGLPMWLAVCGPLVAAVVVIARAADWTAISDAVTKGGADVGEKVANSSPGFEAAIGIGALLLVFSVIAALALYPVFAGVGAALVVLGPAFWRHRGALAAAHQGGLWRLWPAAWLCRAVLHRHSIATSMLAGAIGARVRQIPAWPASGGRAAAWCWWVMWRRRSAIRQSTDLRRVRALAARHGIA